MESEGSNLVRMDELSISTSENESAPLQIHNNNEETKEDIPLSIRRNRRY